MKSNGWLKSIGVAYLVVANSIVLVVVTILGIFSFWWLSDGSRKEGYSTRNFVSDMIPEVRREYADLDDKTVNELLSETWNVNDGGWVYEQWLGFRERARALKFINVNEFGIRSNGHPTGRFAPIDGSIWFFGGSTTFGYGVADNETIPAFLQQATHRDVVNFGRGYFYSAQENLLLKQLLAVGLAPSKVVFLDGINERCNIDIYQTEMGKLFNTAQVATDWKTTNIYRPVKYLVYNILLKIGGTFGHSAIFEPDVMRLACSRFGADRKLAEVLRASLIERRLLCEQYGLECVTFVQPFAGVHGIHADKKVLNDDVRLMLKSHYDALKGVFAEIGAVSLVDVLDAKKTQAYVDNVHYSASANKLIADAIASRIFPQMAQP